MIAISILLVIGFASGVAHWILAERSVRFRIDLQPGESAFHGRSRVYQRNILSRANYSPAGYRLYRWLVITYLLIAAAFTAAAVLFAIRYVWV